MTKKTIFVSMPSYDRKALVSTMTSIFQTTVTSKKAQIHFFAECGDSLVSRARCNAFSNFLFSSKDDIFLFIDSDITIMNTFPQNNAFDKIVDGINSGKDIICGLYSCKDSSRRCSSFFEYEDNHQPQYSIESKYEKLIWGATGFMAISRRCALDFVDKYPNLVYIGDGHYVNQKRILAFNSLLVDLAVKNEKGEQVDTFKKLLSEDYAFSELCNQIGYDTWADTSIMLSHDGFNYFDIPTNEVKLPVYDPNIKISEVKVNLEKI